MKIGVISDTHGNLRGMFHMADVLVQGHQAELLFHLGDDYSDGEALSAAGYPVRFVPGLWCAEYHHPRVAKIIVTELEGITLALAHTLEDARRNTRDAAIYLHGHTHAARIIREGRTLLINLGHLKERTSLGQRPSAGLLELTEKSIHAAILETSGAIRLEETIPRKALK